MCVIQRGGGKFNEGALNNCTCTYLFCRMPQMNDVCLGVLTMKVCTACYIVPYIGKFSLLKYFREGH